MSNPAVQLIVKMIVSGIFVGIISELAKRLPGVGGLVAALPIVSLLTIFWLRVDGADNGAVSRLIFGILVGLIPTSLFLITVKSLIDRSLPLLPAIGVGFVVLAVAWFVVRALVVT